MTHKIHPVILCGGSGTRLWPLSTPARPKQFLLLTSNESMIQDTVDRVAAPLHPSLSFDVPMIIGSKRHQVVLDEKFPAAKKILEPFGRNSAPAVAAACLAYDPDDLVLILSADHDIQDVTAFHDAIFAAAEAASQDAIVTFGIQPSHPATGYGYIKAGQAAGDGTALPVDAFVEKPDFETAQSYLADGSYYWNAGIFLFKARVMQMALRAHAPDVLKGVEAAMGPLDTEQIHLDPTAFATSPSISIDYAVMEKAENVKTVPVNMGWSDVGGFRALHELLTESDRDNYTYGPVHVVESEGVYVRSEGPAVSVSGVSDLVIVATENEVMITPSKDDVSVKALGTEVQTHRHRLGFSQSLRDAARTWLWEAFDVWAKVAWDEQRGGFIERLGMDGKPDIDANRRTRVQARQVFSFAKAVEFGWPNQKAARTLVERGLEHLDTKLRHPEGGWVHLTSADEAILDQKRALYDHAFIILAGSAAYQATQSERALVIAEDAVAYVEAHLKDSDHGGWSQADPVELPRKANPHMHMLEAMLAYYDATGRAQALELASETVRLFETRYFNPANDVMGEFFTADWQAEASIDATVFEPGHHYEWAALLYMYDQLTGHDTLSWRRRLIRRADQSGRNPKTGFAVNAVHANGTFSNSNGRLWHQIELFRAYLMHPGLAHRAKAEALIERIFQTYLNAGPKGGWVDEIDADGNSVSDTVPASMLYHAVTAFAPLI